jgi:hypothetical protein
MSSIQSGELLLAILLIAEIAINIILRNLFHHLHAKMLNTVGPDEATFYFYDKVHCKIGIVFPVPSRDVTNQTLPGRKKLNYFRSGRV